MATGISKDPFYQTFASIVCKKREIEREGKRERMNFPLYIYIKRRGREVQQVGKFMRKEKRNESAHEMIILLRFNAIRKIEDRITDISIFDTKRL